MKKYADKILLTVAIITLVCVIAEAPLMIDAQKAEQKESEIRQKEWRKEWFEQLKKEIQENEEMP